MSRGIVMIAFGEQYERYALAALNYSIHNLDCEVVVFVNSKKSDSRWSALKNVRLVRFDKPQDSNREVKTNIIDYTPFGETIYVDCDSVFQKQGIEKYFTEIPNNGLLLNLFGNWREGYKLSTVYRKAFERVSLSLPMTIYYGACFGFKKNEETRKFFKLWNYYWNLNGCGRDMPSLAVAVKLSGIDKKVLIRADGMFSWPISRNTVIQHEYRGRVRQRIGLRGFRPHKPFDRKGWNR